MIVGLLIAVKSPAAGADAVRPGDRFGTADYCTVGPAVGSLIFVAQHCTPSVGVGGHLTVNGTKLRTVDVGGGERADWTALAAPNDRAGYPDGTAAWTGGVTEWTDCPPIGSAGPCKQAGPMQAVDVARVGVIQPWVGLPVRKSAPTSGSTAGVVNSVNDLWIQGATQCSGDSGAPLLTELDGELYFVGMATNGDGSMDSSGEEFHDKVCRRTTSSLLGVSIETLCDQLNAAVIGDRLAADRQACLDEAGRPRGDLDRITARDGRVLLAGWSFDPDTPTFGVTDVTFTVDGFAHPTFRSWDIATARHDILSRFHLAGMPGFEVRRNFGFSVPFQMADGFHTVCATFGDTGVQFGTDYTAPCRSFSLCDGALTVPVSRNAPCALTANQPRLRSLPAVD